MPAENVASRTPAIQRKFLLRDGAQAFWVSFYTEDVSIEGWIAIIMKEGWRGLLIIAHHL